MSVVSIAQLALAYETAKKEAEPLLKLYQTTNRELRLAHDAFYQKYKMPPEKAIYRCALQNQQLNPILLGKFLKWSTLEPKGGSTSKNLKSAAHEFHAAFYTAEEDPKMQTYRLAKEAFKNAAFTRSLPSAAVDWRGLSIDTQRKYMKWCTQSPKIC
jgi:hypothetical protein